jgi:uncharacterized phosphosugar-binding protein
MRYVEKAIEVLRALDHDQVRKAAERIAGAIEAGGSVFSFGASHAFMVTEELVYRAGGLMLVNPVYPHGMNLGVRPLTLTSQLERVVGLGRELLAASAARQGDVLIVTSNSGRNAVAIDMALLARERGIVTVAITALSYAGRAASRHPCGRCLPELCDVVVDTQVPYGDAAVEVAGCPQKVGPLSTIAGCAIANELVVQTVEMLVARGMEPPVFMSANVDGGDAYNARLLERHRSRIHYL